MAISTATVPNTPRTPKATSAVESISSIAAATIASHSAPQARVAAKSACDRAGADRMKTGIGLGRIPVKSHRRARRRT
jgi:hypothetical protein